MKMDRTGGRNSRKRFKMSESHALRNVKDSSDVANDGGSSNSTNCIRHLSREAKFYCKCHEVVMCAVCASSDIHKLCDTVEVTSDNINKDELREISEKWNKQMRATVDHLKNLQTLRQESKRVFKQKLEDVRESMQKVRDEVIKLMDNIVNHILNVTKQIELKNEDKLDEAMLRVSNIRELAEEKLALLDTAEKFGSQRHKFISTCLMKAQFIEIEKKASEEGAQLNIIDAKLEIANDINNLIENDDIRNLVQVKVSESECSQNPLVAGLNYLRDTQLVRAEEHSVCPNAECEPCFGGIAIHKDGQVILSDTCGAKDCGFLCLYNPSDGSMSKLKLNKPISAASMDDTHVVVSIPNGKEICIVTVSDELKVEKRLKTHREPGQIVALKNGQFAVSWESPPSFSIIDISGGGIVETTYMDQDRSGRKFKSFSYMAVDETRQHIIQSCNEENAVYCFDYTGEPVFQYADPRLKSPRGVALDKCGNIYVCDWRSHSIHKLSPLGELVIIKTEDVHTTPHTICSDNAGTGFWVTRVWSSTDRVVYLKLEQKVET